MTGIRVTVALSRRQADAVLRAELSVGYGVRRSVDLTEAERRLHAAIRAALDNPSPRQSEPGN